MIFQKKTRKMKIQKKVMMLVVVAEVQIVTPVKTTLTL
jgi:hypothetical protein